MALKQPMAVLLILSLNVPSLWAQDQKSQQAAASKTAGPTITINHQPPTDIPGGAQQANLQQAAAFAWQEFIALNWPAAAQQGLQGQRDTPDPSKKFGGDYNGPLVWETFRSKVETYPGVGTPNGYVNDAARDYGYDALPAYTYQIPPSPCNGQTAPSQPAWINLDEVTQIGLNNVYAGALGTLTPDRNSQPPLIRFLAKSNRAYYKYVVSNGFWNHGGDTEGHVGYKDRVRNFRNAIANPNGQPPPESDIISFENGTIMVKAAWRLAAPGEDLSRFHSTTVRYYESAPGATPVDPRPCYYEDDGSNRAQTWVLIALHIVHKTPSAPYFTFASFEQADNLLTKMGDRVENVDGFPNTEGNPYQPHLTYQDGYNNQAGPTPTITTHGSFVTDFGKRIYYKNLAEGSPKDTNGQGGIAVQRRAHYIPNQVIHANIDAHNAIKAYNQANNIGDSPWLYYKLVNIQYQPFNKTQIGSPYVDKNPATYYMANSVVESNYSLANFTGAQVSSGAYQGNTTNFGENGNTPVNNVFVPDGNLYQRFNMGGCMGCHGVAQKNGNDFSFLLEFGRNRLPESPIEAPTLTEKYTKPFK